MLSQKMTFDLDTIRNFPLLLLYTLYYEIKTHMLNIEKHKTKQSGM